MLNPLFSAILITYSNNLLVKIQLYSLMNLIKTLPHDIMSPARLMSQQQTKFLCHKTQGSSKSAPSSLH